MAIGWRNENCGKRYASPLSIGSGKTYENEILNREVQKTLPSANITRILSMILIALSSETITTQTESTLQFR